MRDIAWDNDSAVTEVSGELVIGGEVAAASDLSVSRSIPSNLPAQVAGVGGYEASTASATVLQAGPVSDRSPTPWGSETPQPLTPVEVYAKAGTSRVKIFSGVVDKGSGKASDSDAPISMVDSTDRLNRAVTIRPLCRIMPSRSTDGSTNPRNIGLVSTYFVDRALRECGFYATPPMMGYCVVSAPLMGSTWPERGTIQFSGREGSWTNNPYWTTSPWGVAGGKLQVDYLPDVERWSGRDGTLNYPMEIMLSAGSSQGTSGRVAAEWPNGAKIGVSVTSARSIVVQIMYYQRPGEWQTVLSATAGETLGGWRDAVVRFTPNNGRLDVEIRTNNRGYAVRRGMSVPYGVQQAPLSMVSVNLPDNNIGGIQVGFPGGATDPASFKRSAFLTSPTPMVNMTGSPAIENVPAVDLLTEWAEAECAAMWIDEDGVFQWRNRERFISGAPVAELTSTNDILDLAWSHDAQGAAARAVVKHQTVGVQRSKRSRIQVWQGSGQTMDPGDVQEEFAACPDDEAWIGVDTTLSEFQAETMKQAFNKGEGSWAGYVAYDKNDDRAGNTEYVGYTVEIGNVGISTYKITQLWDGKVPTGVSYIKLQTQDEPGVLKPQWQGFNLPVLRAQCRLRFADQQFTADVGGPVAASDLVHDAGWWVQHPDAVRSLAYWLAQQTKTPLPVVDGVETTGDARLMLGDMVTVTDTHRTGLRITGTVRDIQDSVAAGDHSQTLQLLVIKVEATRPTLFEYDQLWAGATLAARDEAWASQTLGAFDAAPLTRR